MRKEFTIKDTGMQIIFDYIGGGDKVASAVQSMNDIRSTEVLYRVDMESKNILSVQ